MALQLANSDWTYISQMIYRIDQCTTYQEYAETALSQIRALVPYTKGIVFQAQREGRLIHMVSPYTIDARGRTFDEDKYVHGDYNARWANYMYIPWSSVFRYADICSAEEWTQTPIYRDILAPQQLHRGLYTTLVHQDQPVGAIVLWRSKEMEDYNEREMLIMDTMKIHFELRLYQILSSMASVASVHMPDLAAFARSHELTAREQEIVTLLFSGLDGQKICEQLFITDSTLRKHIHNVYLKTDCRTRVQLIRMIEDSAK